MVVVWCCLIYLLFLFDFEDTEQSNLVVGFEYTVYPHSTYSHTYSIYCTAIQPVYRILYTTVPKRILVQ